LACGRRATPKRHGAAMAILTAGVWLCLY